MYSTLYQLPTPSFIQRIITSIVWLAYLSAFRYTKGKEEANEEKICTLYFI